MICINCGRGSDVPYTCGKDTEFEVLYRAVAGDARERFTEVQQLVFRNALKMEGVKRAEQLLVDWNLRRQAWVWKWVPGDHYYAEGEKFDRYEDAERHLKRLGFAVLGLSERVARIDSHE